jgi:hypothetical protein
MNTKFKAAKILTICALSLLTLFTLPSYAISVNVQSPSPQVAALGFTVNGSKHGGAGQRYSGNNMPAGMYSFGIRVGGVLGTDVPCSINGRSTASLTRNANVTLIYRGNRCIARIN